MTEIVKPVRPKSNLALPGWMFLAAVVLAILVLAIPRVVGGAGAAAAYAIDYRVKTHELQAADVDRIVLDRLSAMGGESIPGAVTKMTVALMSDLPSIEPTAGSPAEGSPDGDSTVWIVRASGSFVGLRVPPGAKPIAADSGYFLVDDKTGEIVGMGMP